MKMLGNGKRRRRRRVSCLPFNMRGIVKTNVLFDTWSTVCDDGRAYGARRGRRDEAVAQDGRDREGE